MKPKRYVFQTVSNISIDSSSLTQVKPKFNVHKTLSTFYYVHTIYNGSQSGIILGQHFVAKNSVREGWYFSYFLALAHYHELFLRLCCCLNNCCDEIPLSPTVSCSLQLNQSFFLKTTFLTHSHDLQTGCLCSPYKPLPYCNRKASTCVYFTNCCPTVITVITVLNAWSSSL